MAKSPDPDFRRMPLDASNHAVIAMSAAGAVLYWSTGAQILFGYTNSDAVGRNVEELVVPPGGREAERKMLGTALESGVATYEASRKAQDGRLIHVEVTKWAVRDTDGTLKFVVSIERLANGRA